MYKIAFVNNSGEIKSEKFNTKQEAENWLLDLAVIEGFKSGRIRNLETNEEERIDI